MPAESQQIPSVWTRPQRARRRDQPALSREQIVAEAVAILDAEGLDALSMRRLGARLNAGATSMYTHVANKEELLELVVDTVFGELRLPDPDAAPGWRPAMVDTARTMRETALRHPWLVNVLGDLGLAYLGPNMMRLSEAMLAILEEDGFELLEASEAMTIVFAYVIGTASSEAAWLTTVTRHGQGEHEWVRRLLPLAIEATSGHPRLQRLYSAIQAQGDYDRDRAFDEGLNCVIDGIELSHVLRLEARAERTAAAGPRV
ncbi:TetR/AcrR family transcriptional regulator [Kitasatospora sp. NPDC054939]